MQVFSSTDLNFSDSAIDHFLSSLVNRGKGVGIKIGVKKAGCSGYEYFFDYVDTFDDDGVVFEKNLKFARMQLGLKFFYFSQRLLRLNPSI